MSTLNVIEECSAEESNNESKLELASGFSTWKGSESKEGQETEIADPPSYSFHPSLNFEDSNKVLSVAANRIHTDETLRLFDCMPKGFANFLELGPSRRVSDSMDYEKLCTLHTKKMEYLTEQNIPLVTRAREIQTKNLELQNHIKNFEPMIEEVHRKTQEAKKIYQQSYIANREMIIELPKAQRLLDRIKFKRNKVIDRVIKYEKVNHFIERLLKHSESQFDSINAIMDRNSTLISTNIRLMKRYMDRHQIQEALAEEVQVTLNMERTHGIFLRHDMTELRKELQKKARQNIDLELKCVEWREMTTDRILNLFRIRTSINSMAEGILKMRPYMAHKLEGVTSPCEKIELIGNFILDYAEILRRLKIKLKQQTLEHQQKHQQHHHHENFVD